MCSRQEEPSSGKAKWAQVPPGLTCRTPQVTVISPTPRADRRRTETQAQGQTLFTLRRLPPNQTEFLVVSVLQAVIRKAHNLAATLCPSQGQGTNAPPAPPHQSPQIPAFIMQQRKWLLTQKPPQKSKGPARPWLWCTNGGDRAAGGAGRKRKESAGTPGSRDREAVLGRRHSTGHWFPFFSWHPPRPEYRVKLS